MKGKAKLRHSAEKTYTLLNSYKTNMTITETPESFSYNVLYKLYVTC